MKLVAAVGRRFVVVALLCVCSVGASYGQGSFDATVSKWRSYEDVAKWLRTNFVFDRTRLQTIIARTREQGPSGLLARSAARTYQLRNGYCTDAANFAIQALNKINPAYEARYVFIKNEYGRPHHWVAGFKVKGGIMIMDYGAGPEWQAINGVHGPYQSLNQYADFLRSLRIKRFSPESVEWRARFPGQQD